MIWLKSRLPHHSLPQQILALALAWLTVAPGLPTNALAAPLPVARPLRWAGSLAASALPQGVEPPADASVIANAKAKAMAKARKRANAQANAEAYAKYNGEEEAKKHEEEAKKWGEITVGQPKIWQYERVNSLLDGLLRDVQGVSMSDLVSLDANATNGAAVKFVQSMLEIGVKYDQGAAVTNAIALKNYAATQGIASAQIQANSTYLQQLYAQRTSVTGQLLAATQQNAALQGQLATTDPTSTAYKSLATQQQAAASEVTGLQAELTSINSQIAAASTATIPPAPSLASTTANPAPESANTFSSFLSGLPSGLTTNLVNQLQSPSLPATKRMDNFMTLLYERLAREISVLQDDVMRDPDNVAYLVQFDVGLYPGVRAKNHVGVVEFTMDCDGCKVYSVYPGQSSYNLANYEAASKRYSIWGALSTIFGLGVSADYRRQTDTLHGDLVQSVYISGFQDDAPTADPPRINEETMDDCTKEKKKVPAKNCPAERFGWYYGAAPFETLVSPGVRSTFAIVSVPRSLIEKCVEHIKTEAEIKNGTDDEVCFKLGLGRVVENKTANTSIRLKIYARVNWVRRDDPFKQQKGNPPNSFVGSSRSVGSWFAGSRLNLEGGRNSTAKLLEVTLPGTERVLNVPMIVRAERDRLHVLGMEYNPVYDAPTTPPAVGAAASTTTPAPGTASASASGNGSGTTTITVSGAGTASASSSGTTSTSATATAANPTTAPPSKSPSPADPLTGCKQGQCAVILVRMAEPLDPNLVVTVRGLPLQRVRDWRGRATSVLPPAQSGSDIRSLSATLAAGPAAAIAGAENAPSASLLEADLPGPDTWMEVDSHRLLLTISKDLVGDNEEFPTIQILDPAKRALFLPLELDTQFSELIMNEFHFPTRNGEQFKAYLRNHLSRSPITVVVEPRDAEKLHPAGPYPPETFLPLFLPNPAPQPIYAYLGETGAQILIGFDKTQPTAPKAGADTRPKDWLAGRTQVVLEDRSLDLAWSLTCYPQSPLLVCDVPLQQIGDAYDIVQAVCKPQRACPSIPAVLTDGKSISTLQVWVDQYDPENGDSFYSPTPARLGRFPLPIKRGVEDAKPAVPGDAKPTVGFRPWYFESATADNVTLTECRYPEFEVEAKSGEAKLTGAVKILGRGIPDNLRTQTVRESTPEPGCKSLYIPTLALTYKEVVFEYPSTPKVPDPCAGKTPCTTKTPDPCAGETACAPESLATSLFQPYFEAAVAIPHFPPIPGNGSARTIDYWTIDIPAGRADCNDASNIPGASTKFSARWKVGANPPIPLREMGEAVATQGTDDPVPPRCYDTLAGPANRDKVKKAVDNWTDASKTGQLVLELVVKRKDLDSLPMGNLPKDRIQILRGPLLSKIATLPDLRPSFLPTKLTVVTEGPNQFALQGDNAGVIDAVMVQGPDGAVNTIATVSAGNIANVTLPAPAKNPAKTGAAAKPTITKYSMESVPAGTMIEIKGSNFGIEAGTVTFGPPKTAVTAHVGTGCWADQLIQVDVPPGVSLGSVDVTITTKTTGAAAANGKFMIEGKPLDKAQTIICTAADNATPTDGQANSGPKAGAYSVVPLIILTRDADGKPPQYMPLDVTDLNGKPLSFTATEKKDSGSNPPKGVDSPTTTLTISKKTTVTPPATSTSGGQ